MNEHSIRISDSRVLIAGKLVHVPAAVITVVPSWRPQAIIDGAGKPVAVVRFSKWAVIKHRAWKLWRRVTS